MLSRYFTTFVSLNDYFSEDFSFHRSKPYTTPTPNSSQPMVIVQSKMFGYSDRSSLVSWRSWQAHIWFRNINWCNRLCLYASISWCINILDPRSHLPNWALCFLRSAFCFLLSVLFVYALWWSACLLLADHHSTLVRSQRVISLGIQLTQTLADYYKTLKH